MHFGRRKFLSLFAVGALGMAGLLASVGVAGAAPVAPSGGADVTSASPPIVVLTQADNGKTINVAPGSYIVVTLDNGLDWTVASSNPGVVSKVPYSWGSNSVTIFHANAAGKATLNGEGRPHCEPGQVCPLFIELWSANINVIGIVPLASD